MFPATAGSVVGEGGRADGAPAGRAGEASAGSTIPEGVSAGPPDLRQFLMAARAGDARASARGEKLAPGDIRTMRKSTDIRTIQAMIRVTEFHREHPGGAPPIDPREEYYLFPPGVDARMDLANPGCNLAERCRSYKLYNLRGFDVRVLLGKRCFEILASPPPVEGCLNSINRAGILTVGFGSATDTAWILVLKVLDQVREQDLPPEPMAFDLAL